MAEQEKNVPAEKKAEKPAKAKKPSIFARIGKWFRELKGECKKIVSADPPADHQQHRSRSGDLPDHRCVYLGAGRCLPVRRIRPHPLI